MTDSPLFPDLRHRRNHEEWLTRALLDAVERVAEGPVTPTIDRAALQRDLREYDFSVPRQLEQVLSWTIAQLENGVTHITNPRYLGLFNPAPTYPAECADRIAAAFNPQLATATTSPAAVEIEAHVIRQVAARAGLPPNATGHFTSGGAEANFTALVCALTAANDRYGELGARAFAGPVAVYASRESHLAWFKIAHQAGIGRSAVNLIDTDGNGRMDPIALAAAIERDRRNRAIPVMVVATAGTTNAGMVDPLVACAKISREFGLWYHIDAAWGGALIASEVLRNQLSGIEQADSVTIDAHKWFAATMGCGMFLSAHPDVMERAFAVSTGYMPSHNAERDPFLNSIQWSRRFVGLRLFLSLAAAGWDGYARHVEHAVAMIAVLRTGLEARGWRIVNNSTMAVLCAVPPPGSEDVAAIVRRVLASGRAWVSTAQFEGRPVLRACATHGGLTPGDIAEIVDLLDAARTPAGAGSDCRRLPRNHDARLCGKG